MKFQELVKILDNKKFIESLRECAEFIHTSAVENFHSVRLKWLSKKSKFLWEYYDMRAKVAALDHNANVNREAIIKKSGSPRTATRFSKGTVYMY